MKKKVTKKVEVKKPIVKKAPAKKAPVKAKKPVKKEDNPLNAKNAIAELRKHYTALAKLNVQRTIVLESISKKEAELAEVLDLNLAKVEDKSNETLLNNMSKPDAVKSLDTTDLRLRTVTSPFKEATSGVLNGLNAVACRY